MKQKVCSKCKVEKLVSEFGTRSGQQSHLLRSYCRDCEARGAYRKRTPKYRWDKHLSVADKTQRNKIKSRYGLSQREFEELVLSQNATCAICHSVLTYKRGSSNKTRAHIDHDHQTKKVRGILCYGCNAIGMAQDDPERLMRMVVYLRSASS